MVSNLLDFINCLVFQQSYARAQGHREVAASAGLCSSTESDSDCLLCQRDLCPLSQRHLLAELLYLGDPRDQSSVLSTVLHAVSSKGVGSDSFSIDINKMNHTDSARGLQLPVKIVTVSNHFKSPSTVS